MKRALLSVLISGALFGCGGETTEPPKTEPVPPSDTAPVASNLVIVGEPMIGNTITLNYDYYDAEGHSEGDSIISWFINVNGSVSPISSGTDKALLLSGLAGQVGGIYATVKPIATEGTDKDLADEAYSSTIQTYPTGSAPQVANIEISSPKALADGVPITLFYDYSDADGDAEYDGGALITWMNRADGTVLGTGKTLNLPVGYAGMTIGADVVARSVGHDQGASGKTEADAVEVADLSGVVVSEPYVKQIDTANTGWGDGVFLIKNIRNELLLVRSHYDRASNDQLRLSSLDVYKLTDDANHYTYDSGFLRSNDANFDHITFSLGVNGYESPLASPVTPSDYYDVKIGYVPFTGAGGGIIETFLKPTDAKFWGQGASLYDDGSVVLDQDVLFNADNNPVSWSLPNALTLDFNNEVHVNDVDVNAPNFSWYNSVMAFEAGVADATALVGSMESGDHTNTTRTTLSQIVTNGINADAHGITSPIVEGYAYEESLAGNSTVSSDVRANTIHSLQDGSYWVADADLMTYFNTRISAKWPTFVADSTTILSVGKGSRSPMLLTQEGVNGSYVYSEDSFSGDPSDISRYKLPFELDSVDFTVVCTNTNSLYPPAAQGSHNGGGDVNLQAPNTSAATVPVVPSQGGSGALVAIDPLGDQMWFVDTDYASSGVTLSYSESGVTEVRSGTHFEACDSSHGIKPTIVVKNSVNEDVSVLTTESVSQSYGANPRLSGNLLTVKVASGQEGVSGDLASASLVSKLTTENFLSSSIADLNVWVREDDGDTYVRVSDLSAGKMVFQDSAGASLGGTHMLTGIAGLMTDADTGRVAKNQEGFVVSDSGLVFSSFADTLRIGGVTDLGQFESKLVEAYKAVNSNSLAFGEKVSLSFDYSSSNYPLAD